MDCLVFISNNGTVPEIRGTTHMAKKVGSNENWTDVILLTDENGYSKNNSNITTVLNNNIVSDRNYVDIYPKTIYYFAPLYSSPEIVANNFVIKNDNDDRIRNTTKNGLGSGINGIYVKNYDELASIKINNNQTVYKIDYSGPLNVQDAEHGDSITTASLATNRYLDDVVRSLKFNKEVTYEIAFNYLVNNDHTNLVNLWNIVLVRNNKSISIEELDKVLATYLYDYFNDTTLTDSITNEFIQPLPINYIFNYLGYDGIIAKDYYNNGWYRGCYCYDYSKATILKGDVSRY
jgi:hypothetical protein